MASRPRAMGRSIAFGQCFLTPRFKDKLLCGFQMTCTRPEHNADRRCTKEVSFGVAGGEDNCRRLLKSWIVFGACAPSRDAHREVFADVSRMKNTGGYPLEADLDRQAPEHWAPFASTTVAGETQCCSLSLFALDTSTSFLARTCSTLIFPACLFCLFVVCRGERLVRDTPREATPSLLGAAAPGVPAEVHREMERLAAMGALPITSPDQRARQKFSKGSAYAVPQMYKQARDYKYLTPNLPPPTGLVWRCRGQNEWILCHKGG
eukprot:2702965-Amphidinium_carterae.1